MSLASQVLSIDGTQVLIASANGMPLEVNLHSASGQLYIGASGVTTATGFRIDNGDKLTLTVPDGSSLYGISASGTQTLYVLTAVL